ncbi:hypothetical protein DRQ09_09795 [candidate division KSB1 bacterium]|nr:MAG: hypothetical protein DRQ09_09795 [candidate division KSB1 bacterium]
MDIVKNFQKIAFLLLIILIFNGSICKGPTEVVNHNPEIQNLIVSKKEVNFKEKITLLAVLYDEDGDSLSTDWYSKKGFFSYVSLDSAVWNAPDSSGIAVIYLKVKDNRGGSCLDSVSITINNRVPVITSVTATPKNVIVGNDVLLECSASDPDGGPLTYLWSCETGSFSTPDENTTLWTAPLNPTSAEIIITVTDVEGGVAKDTVVINVFLELGSLWVTDTFNHEIVKISPEGNELFRLSGYSLPVSLDINLNDRTVIVVDKDANRAVKISPTGDVLKEILNLESPNYVSVYSFTGEFWITQEGDSNQVVKFSSDGEKILTRVSGFKNPRGISVDQTTGDVWIADTGNDRIVKLYYNIPENYNIEKKYPPDSIFYEIYTGFKNPGHLSVNPSTGNCWVSDKSNNRVVRIKKDGTEMLEITGFSSPEGIAVNKKDGSCWVANKGANEVIKLFSNLSQEISGYNIVEKQGFHQSIKDFIQPQAVTINTNDSIVWFSEEYRIVKVEDKGNNPPVILGTFSGFNSPKSLKVNPGE